MVAVFAFEANRAGRLNRLVIRQALGALDKGVLYTCKRHRRMKKLIALLYLSFAAALSLGQTVNSGAGVGPATNPLVDRLERLSKRFPPELADPMKDWYPAKVSRYCVYPSPDQKSFSIKPCQTTPRRFRLMPPLRDRGPASKP